MSFFLLAKHPDARLELLSTALFETRQDALAELSVITADSTFDSWDAEVLVANVDTATPVLLMRAVASEGAQGMAPEMEPEREPAPVLKDLTPAGEDAFVAVADDEFVAEVDPAWAAAAIETVEADDMLRAALFRTTEQMESEGVIAPASVEAMSAPSPQRMEPEPQPAPEIVPEPSLVQPEPPMTAEEPAPPMSIAGPMSASDVPAWPWDAEAEVPPAPIVGLDSIDEDIPDDDAPGLVRAAGDDAAMAASRPVILGAYDMATVSPVAATDPADSAAIVESTVATEVVPREQGAPAEELQRDVTGMGMAPGRPDAMPESDFILDLDPIAAVPAPPGYEVSAESDSEISTMSCDDCVFVGTCPNKDERDPSSCGSFQWK